MSQLTPGIRSWLIDAMIHHPEFGDVFFNETIKRLSESTGKPLSHFQRKPKPQLKPLPRPSGDLIASSVNVMLDELVMTKFDKEAREKNLARGSLLRVLIADLIKSEGYEPPTMTHLQKYGELYAPGSLNVSLTLGDEWVWGLTSFCARHRWSLRDLVIHVLYGRYAPDLQPATDGLPPPRKTVTFRVSPGSMSSLDFAARERGMSRAALVREVLLEHLSELSGLDARSLPYRSLGKPSANGDYVFAVSFNNDWAVALRDVAALRGVTQIELVESVVREEFGL